MSLSLSLSLSVTEMDLRKEVSASVLSLSLVVEPRNKDVLLTLDRANRMTNSKIKRNYSMSVTNIYSLRKRNEIYVQMIVNCNETEFMEYFTCVSYSGRMENVPYKFQQA